MTQKVVFRQIVTELACIIWSKSHRFEGERNRLITTHMLDSSRNRRCHDAELVTPHQHCTERSVVQVRVDFLRTIGHPDAEKAAAYVEQIWP